jgi:cytochrome c oxidase assembly protein subunit 17
MNNQENKILENFELKITQEKMKLRPCCACPETKKIRDDCIFHKGEENCFEFIEKHKACLREQGFEVN